MSGPLVGLVIEHGPRDHNQWAVLVVVAENLYGPFNVVVLTDDDLMRCTRLGRTSVRRAIKGLYADGWLGGHRGKHKGHASAYAMRFDAFPADAVERVIHKPPKGSPHDPSQESKGVATRPLSEPKGSPRDSKGSPHDPLSVYVSHPSSPEPAALPVLVGVASAADDDDDRALSEGEIAEVVFDGLPVPMPRSVRKLAAPWVDAGWLASDLNRHLLDNVNPAKCESVVAVVRSLLTNVEPPPAAHQRKEFPPLCGECDERWVYDDDGRARRCTTCGYPVEIASRVG